MQVCGADWAGAVRTQGSGPACVAHASIGMAAPRVYSLHLSLWHVVSELRAGRPLAEWPQNRRTTKQAEQGYMQGTHRKADAEMAALLTAGAASCAPSISGGRCTPCCGVPRLVLMVSCPLV